MKKFLERLKKARKDQRGNTMIEVVTTLAVLVIILPLFAIITTSAFGSREVANTLMTNTLNTTGVQSGLTNDVKTASALRITDGNSLQTRSQDGNCVSWKLRDGNLLRAASENSIDESSPWQVIGEYFSPIGDSDAFQMDAPGVINYGFKIGTEKMSNELTGSAAQKSASSGSGDCW